MKNIEYYENGKIKSCKYLEEYGNRYEEFNLEGKIMKCTTYLSDGRIYKEITYYENGQKKNCKTYEGEKNIYEEFYPNGQRKLVQTFMKGRCVRQMRYGEDGSKDKTDMAVIITKEVAKTVFKIGKAIGKSFLEQAAKRK